MLDFTGERIVPGAANCEPTFAQKMYQEHIARYAFAAQFVKGKVVLDVGCGVGYGSQWLARAGAAEVTAFDVAEDAVAHAKSHYFDPALTYHVASATDFDFGQKFDVVVCFELIEHVAEQEEVLKRIAAALKPGGVLVISTPRPLDEERTHFHEKELSYDDFRALLKTRFENLVSWSERNYFTSYIGEDKPETLENIVPVTDQFGLVSADYFIFVATNAQISSLPEFKGTISVNDDSYILNLEKDVGILRRGEDDAKEKLGIAQEALQAAQARLTDSSARLMALEDEAAAAREAAQTAQWAAEVVRTEATQAQQQAAETHRLFNEAVEERERTVAALQAANAEHIAQLADLTARAGLLEQQVEQSRSEEQRLSASLITAGARADAVIAELELSRKRETLMAEAALRADAETRRTLLDLDRQLIAAEDRATRESARLRDQLSDTQTARQAAEASRQETERELARARGALDEVQRSLRKADETQEALQERLFDAGQELKRRAETIAAAADEKDRLTAAVDMAQQVAAEAMAETRHLTNDRQGALNELEELKAAFRDMEAHAVEQTRLRDAMEREITGLRKRSDSLDIVRASMSWRLGKPMRWIEKRLPQNLRKRVSGPLDLYTSRSFAAALAASAPQPAPPVSQGVQEPAVPAPAYRDLDILFIIGCWEGESKRYRVYNIIEGLQALGYSAASVDAGQMRVIIEQDIRPKTAVFFRSPFDVRHGVVDVLERFRQTGVRTVYDIDDYVFEPAIQDQIAGLAYLTAEQKAEYEWGVRAYRSMLLSCDAATASTQYLVDRIEDLGRSAFVVQNTINADQIERADTLLKIGRLQKDSILACYFSGSKTHARDFEACREGLQAAMRDEPRLRLRVVGHLDLDESWNEFGDRVERQGFMAPLDMLDSQFECDINLAPLEEGNAFCEGKSELKYFEAALVETPTVASRTSPFAGAITDGETGMLASSTAEWKAKLLTLARDAGLRARIGQAARIAAMADFSTRSAASRALVAYGLEVPASRTVSPTGLKIGWIVPGLIIGGGGHRNILRAAFHLESFGHDVRLYFSDTNMSDGELRKAVREHFYPFAGPVSRFEGHVDGEDVMMATHWSTVALAESVKDSIGDIMYFVQDFEPAFYPIGSEYLMAENTYRKNLYAICSGPWCEHLLKRDYGMEADHFRFPVDQDIYYPRPHLKKENRILFFAKPDMPRRCFLIGISALREVHRLRPDIEIMFFGSEAARSHPLDFPVTFSGVLPTIHDLADRYATSMVGMVFSTTNPSLVPYEMMACGLPVVDLGRPGNEVNYDNREDLALLADPEPTIMARQIIAMIDKPGELEARAERGVIFANSFPTEDEMARRVEHLIVERRQKTAAARAPITAKAPSSAATAKSRRTARAKAKAQ